MQKGIGHAIISKTVTECIYEFPVSVDLPHPLPGKLPGHGSALSLAARVTGAGISSEVIMSQLQNANGGEPVSGDGIATATKAPHIARVNDRFKGTAITPKPAPQRAAAIDTGKSFSVTSKKEVDDTYDGFSNLKMWGLWIIGLISVGFGLQISLTTRVVDHDFLNAILAAGTVAGMLYGLFFANKLFNGLRAGAFVGFSKIIAISMLLLIVWEEVTVMPAKFDPALAIFYVKFIGPICLGIYFLATMALVLMKPDEMRTRKINAVTTRTEHNKALRDVRGPERKAKAEARAEKMGSFAAAVARLKLVVLAAVFSVFRGWIITVQQAWALAGDKHEEFGKHIESYESSGRKKKSTRSTPKKARAAGK